jgi:hypothetical protein
VLEVLATFSPPHSVSWARLKAGFDEASGVTGWAPARPTPDGGHRMAAPRHRAPLIEQMLGHALGGVAGI